MAKILSKTGITTGNTVKAFHVTQSVDAFTGTDAYDITISGSLNVTGSITASAVIGANEYRVDGQRVIKVDTTTTPHSLAIYPSSTPALSLGAISGIILNSDITGSFRTISGSKLIGEATNLYRPVLTASLNPFTASSATAGGYYRTGGNITCSIFITESISCTIGSEFEFFQTSSTGNVLFKTGSGVTLNSKNGNLKLTGQFSAATLKYVGNNEWDLIGDLS